MSIFIVSLFAFSAVSAAEANVTDNAIDDVVLASGEPEVLGSNQSTFSSLNELINGNDEKNIFLTENYTFEEGTDDAFRDGIVINRPVTIYGEFHMIDANNNARIFNVTDSNVVFRNIIFTNANATNDASGGAIAGECNAIRCIFINNHADYGGGAMCRGTAQYCSFNGNTAGYTGGAMFGGYAINSVFLNNSAVTGGALSYVEAKNCSFLYNHADSGGAMISGSADKCNFTNNSADCGGAIYESSAKNCIFTGNHADNSGGAIYIGDYARNCIFDSNSAEKGGAGFMIDASDSTFKNNNASLYGGAIYASDAIDCKFKDNVAGYDGDDYYDSNIFLRTSISASGATIVYNANKYLVATLKDSTGKAISNADVIISIMGVSYPLKTDKNGRVKQSLKSLPPKTHNIKFTFENTSKYLKSTKTVKVIVKKATPKITAKAKTFKKSLKTKKYTVSLNVNQKVKVAIKVNKKTYYAYTNTKGKATFKITKLTKKGKYTSTVSFAGNNYYNKAKSVNVKIIVK